MVAIRKRQRISKSKTVMSDEKTYTGFKRFRVRKNILATVLSAVFVALAVAIEFATKSLPHLEFPNGGTLSLTCLPLMVCALLLGPLYGTVAGGLYGLFNFLIDGYAFSWGSFIFDYVLAFSLMGLAGLFRKPFLRGRFWAFLTGAIVAMVGRYLSHCISGAVFFADYAPAGVSPIFYSFVLYNAPYCFGSLGLDLVVGAVLFKPLQSLLSLSGFDPLFLPLKTAKNRTPEARVLLGVLDGQIDPRDLATLVEKRILTLSQAGALADGEGRFYHPALAVLLKRAKRYLTSEKVEEVKRRIKGLE